MVTVDDPGHHRQPPPLAEGQEHGGITQGAAQAFMEEVVYEADGNPLTEIVTDYPFVSGAELPRADQHGHADHPNRLGAKGNGEAGTIGSTRAARTRSSMRWPTWACGTSTCSPPRSGWQALRAAAENQS